MCLIFSAPLTSTDWCPTSVDYIFSEEVAPTMKYDYKKLTSDPSRLALDHAFGVAFHRGLGAPLLASTHKYVNAGAIEQFSAQVYNKANITLVASGASHSELSKWTLEFFKDLKTGAKATSPHTKYYGGETRVQSDAGSSFVVAFPGTAGSPNYKAEYKVLTHLLGGETAVKWNSGFSYLNKAVTDLPGVSAIAKQQHFTDAGLLYITVTGPDNCLERAGHAVVNALKSAANASQEEINKAIAQAKFDVLAGVEDQSIGLELVGQSLLTNATLPQAGEIVHALNAVKINSVQKVC